MSGFDFNSPAMRWMLRRGHEIAGTYKASALTVEFHGSSEADMRTIAVTIKASRDYCRGCRFLEQGEDPKIFECRLFGAVCRVSDDDNGFGPERMAECKGAERHQEIGH